MPRIMEGRSFFNKPWWGSYHSMMDRCYRQTAANYDSYGGRGIRVCEEWHDILNFEEWAESNGFQKGLSIDRIDPNKDYSPDNCRWATPKQQANNRRNTRYLTVDGETHTATEWAEITGIKRSTINNRICRGWPDERALIKEDMRKCHV